jgi:hypothetical protein
MSWEIYRRLEPMPPYQQLDRGFAAEVADPAWLLGRQWQVGEHSGEDAATPVAVTLEVAHTQLAVKDGLDPTVVPPEAIVEGTTADWWTIGRRIRVGRAIAPGLSADQRASLAIGVLPDPYGSDFADEVDGQAAWLAGLIPPDSPHLAGLPSLPDYWDPALLQHHTTFQAGGSTLRLSGHDAGEVDWFSSDADQSLAAPAMVTREVIPQRLRYPGAPLPRWWQVERQTVDIGGFPPDRSHFVTTLLIDLICGHADDWFTFPVPPPAPGPDGSTPPSSGVVVTLSGVKVRNDFDEVDILTIPPGTGDPPAAADEAPGPWSLFRTTGLDRSSLVVWPTAATPLTGPVLDDVILGVDEDANVLWAAELIVDGSELVLTLDSTQALEQTQRTGTRDFTWLPSTTLPAYWHPYRLEPRTNPSRRVFVQGWVADLTRTPPGLRPGPRSELLGAGAGHELEATAVPNQGLRVQRGYLLARGTDGRPVLWRQRRRIPVLGGPVSHLRFDVFSERAVPGG